MKKNNIGSSVESWLREEGIYEEVSASAIKRVSLTSFKRDTNGLMRRMKKTQRSLVLTVKGKAEAVIIHPAAYEKMAGRFDAIESIRRGIAQAKQGLGRPVDEVFDEIERG